MTDERMLRFSPCVLIIRAADHLFVVIKINIWLFHGDQAESHSDHFQSDELMLLIRFSDRKLNDISVSFYRNHQRPG
jgi:hypothetical protein